MDKLKRPAALLACLVLLAGCSTSTVATVSQICEGWQPIYPSRSDKLSDGTTEQIAANNAAAKVWCGARPPFKEPPPLEPRTAANPKPAPAPAQVAAVPKAS